MAYADIQNKVGQIQMANRVLLAQRMDPNKTPETDLEGFQEQGGYAPETDDVNLRDVNTDTPVEGTLTERRRIYPDYKVNRNRRPVKGNNRFKGLTDDQIRAKVAEEAAQRAREAEEERRDQDPELNKQLEDMRQGDYLEDPENPHLNNLLKIGGAAGSMLPVMGWEALKYLFGPKAMASGFPYEFEGGVVTPRYFTPPRYRQQPFLHIRTKDITDEELFHFNNFIKSMGGGLDTVRRQTPLSIAKLPHTPPTEKIVLPNGKLMDSPLRFKTDQERIKFMEDFSKGYGRYS